MRRALELNFRLNEAFWYPKIRTLTKVLKDIELKNNSWLKIKVVMVGIEDIALLSAIDSCNRNDANRRIKRKRKLVEHTVSQREQPSCKQKFRVLLSVPT
jgi:hypothetical protein